jgi:hypothetical protein
LDLFSTEVLSKLFNLKLMLYLLTLIL